MGQRRYGLTGRPRPELAAAVLRRDQHRCCQCGYQPLGLVVRRRCLELDHIIPLARGGLTTLANLQTLCTTCHVAKGRG
jgi:5-methylcytosine-specific restriction endonuclease McrA